MQHSYTQDIDEQLRQMEELAAGSDSRSGNSADYKSHKSASKTTSNTSFSFKGLILSLLSVAFFLIFAMLFLPRITLWIFESVPSLYLSVFGAYALLSIGLLLLLSIGVRLTIGRFKVGKWLFRAVFVFVGIASLYSLLYLSNTNVKDPSVRETFTNLHPVLRIGVTTAVLVDSDLIVTNLGRTKQDYINWGLTPRERSLHYVQPETGYVHALDLRTIGRPEWLNQFTELTFKAMGFHTYRHVGTADHLHVALPVE
jgi:uncharacterized membrane protein YuzA (DUF378 family)